MLKKLKSISSSDNFVVLLGNLSASAFGLFIFMILARSLSKSDFGDWALFISASGLLDLMRTGLVRQALVRSITIEKDESRKAQLLSSALVFTTGISILIGLIVYILSFFTLEASLTSFFTYYPALVIVSALHHFDTWKAHATGHFRRMNKVRLLTNLCFIMAVGYGSFVKPEIDFYFLAYITVQGAVSLYAYLSDLRNVPLSNANLKDVKGLLHFGKHSFVTLTGANLLKSADSLIIGWLLGKEAVAIYAIPLKVLDLVEIPIRGFVMTGFRKLSALHADRNHRAFKNLLIENIKTLSALSFTAGMIILCIPSFFVKILGGEGYVQSNLLLQIFVIPLILLPLDKFIGMSLDAVNKPRTNAIKVWIMVVVNIIGDLMVIYWIGALWAVAAVTILNIIAGISFALLRHPYLKGASQKLILQV